MHVLDDATDYRPADTPVLTHVRGSWRAGRVTAWHRTPVGWIAQVAWATGPPVHSSCVDFLPAEQLRDAGACLTCPAVALRSHSTEALVGSSGQRRPS